MSQDQRSYLVLESAVVDRRYSVIRQIAQVHLPSDTLYWDFFSLMLEQECHGCV